MCCLLLACPLSLPLSLPFLFPATYRVHGVIGKIWPRLIAGRSRRGALPPTHVDSRDVGRHLNYLDGVQGTEGVGAFALCSQLGEQPPQFLGLTIRDGLDEKGGAQGDDVLGGEGRRERGRVSVGRGWRRGRLPDVSFRFH